MGHELAAFSTAPAADPRTKQWALGTLVEGWREGDKPGDIDMAGHVVRNDSRYLAVLFTERWLHEGKPVAPRVLWVWERRSKDGEALELVNVEQRHIGHGTKRCEIPGDVVLRKDKLSGTYEHGWQVKDGPLNHSEGPREVLFSAKR